MYSSFGKHTDGVVSKEEVDRLHYDLSHVSVNRALTMINNFEQNPNTQHISLSEYLNHRTPNIKDTVGRSLQEVKIITAEHLQKFISFIKRTGIRNINALYNREGKPW